MKTKEIIKTASELAKPFRISKGENFRLKDVDPDDTLDFTKEADKPRAKEALTRQVIRPGQVGGAFDLSSNGRGRQGWRHKARHVWDKSARLPSLFFQITLGRGPGSRLPLALHEMPAESGPDWNF